ncbi:TetR/AcrR family transcriptional regulator [Nakamurella sp. GG22]
MPRPHQAILSRELIFQTALEMTDRVGRFTVPELAQRLGVSVSSLYHHVRGRADIVEGIRGLMTPQLTSLNSDTPWENAITEWARAYRDSFAAHPAAIPALVAQTVSAPNTLEQYDLVAGILEKAGFAADAIIMAITMLDTLSLGAALDLAAPSVIWEPRTDQSALSRALAQATPTVDRTRHAFEVQLALIVRELARHLCNERAHRAAPHEIRETLPLNGSNPTPSATT